MRVPLYRIWDNDNNRYFEPTYEAYNGKVEDLTISSFGDLTMRTYNQAAIHESLFPKRFEKPEFFTGLFDKNGIPIYNGDIVVLENSSYEIIINDFMQIPVIDNEEGQLELYKCNSEVIVVGNIHRSTK